jgi:hypothetical protein
VDNAPPAFLCLNERAHSARNTVWGRHLNSTDEGLCDRGYAPSQTLDIGSWRVGRALVARWVSLGVLGWNDRLILAATRCRELLTVLHHNLKVAGIRTDNPSAMDCRRRRSSPLNNLNEFWKAVQAVVIGLVLLLILALVAWVVRVL